MKLQVGDSILLLHDLYTVTEQRIESTTAGHEVFYQLEHDGRPGQLHVVSPNLVSKTTTAQIILDDQTIDIFDDDVVILNRDSEAVTL